MKFAIYGFFFNKKYISESFTFTPINTDSFYEKYKKSKDLQKLYLTGYVETKKIEDNSFDFIMRAVLAFVQQQNVELTQIVNENDNIPNNQISIFERKKCGAPFAFCEDLLFEIVEKLYNKLQDFNDPCNLKTKNSPFEKDHNFEFSSLVYKTIDPMYSRNNSIEIPFFLYFSGLEAFCKQYIKSKLNYNIDDDCALNISYVLEDLKIPYICSKHKSSTYNLRNKIKDEYQYLHLSLYTYSNLRNALFHQNIFVAETECEYNKKGAPKKKLVRIDKYEYYLHKLCNAVIICYLNINNPNFNCSKWWTRENFINK